MINYIEKVREDRRVAHLEACIDHAFELIVSNAIEREPADSYELNVGRIDLVDEESARTVISKVIERFQEEDVAATLAWDPSTMDLRAKLECFREPTEIVNDSANYFWSRAPGKFVNKLNGTPVILNTSMAVGPAFTGTIREWYETLVETVIDIGNAIKKQHGTQPNKVFVGEDVRTILEASMMYRAALDLNGNGLLHIGTLSNRYKVFEKKSLKNTIEVCLDLGHVRHVGTVTVLDMNII